MYKLEGVTSQQPEFYCQSFFYPNNKDYFTIISNFQLLYVLYGLTRIELIFGGTHILLIKNQIFAGKQIKVIQIK